MGHSQTEKTRNHDRIVEVAARRIREAGTEAPGVAEIMSAPGSPTAASTSTSDPATS